MALTNRVRNQLMDQINSLFNVIGTTPATRPPMSALSDRRQAATSNKAMVAWELFIANHLASMANARRKKARELAVEAGVIFDHEEYPEEPGTNRTVYENDSLVITVSVNVPAKRIDGDKLLEYLSDHVDSRLLEKAEKHATRVTRPAHEFRATIRTD